MSLYIDPKNQTLLWNLIHKNPNISLVFPQNSMNSQKNNWFKEIISKIYSTLPPIISNELLLIKNKETLSIMIQDLKNYINETSTTNEISNTVYSRNQLEKPSINNEFEKRQRDYELMTKKPVIEEISFKEKTDDGIIKNMDELIQKQLRERQLDIELISKSYEKNPRTILNIKEEIIAKDELKIENIEEKKKVSWGSNSIIEYHFILEKKIDDLTEKYNDLIEYLENKLPNFISEFLERKMVKEILFEQIERIENPMF
jgi:hypothetical protein